MAVPKKKTSKSKRNMRRSHRSIKIINRVTCYNCGEVKRPHNICKICGYYKGNSTTKTKNLK